MTTNRQSIGTVVGPSARACLLGMALVLLGGFGIASRLQPDLRGFGTHQQMGLPACTARSLLGIPCPGCGMTTSFSHFVRGEFYQAAKANLAGVVLAAVCALMIPWCLGSAYAGRLWFVSYPLEFAGVAAVCLCGLVILIWIMRLTGMS